jgi:sporulation protein YlmC with PRC-barrel domain
MRLELGCPVQCSDGPVGKLADVVIDPTRRRVTHLVVEPHHAHGAARLVPAELASADGATPPAISLRCTGEELRRLPPVQDFAYLRFGEFPLDDPDWDVGIETVMVSPTYDYAGFGENPMDLDPHVAIAYDRIPKGEIEIRRPSGVVSADGHQLGHVDSFLVDSDDRITHVVLARGHLFGRHDVTIPIDAVARVATDEVTLALTKDEVARLPAVPVHRWTARLAGSDGRAPSGPTRRAS